MEEIQIILQELQQLLASADLKNHSKSKGFQILIAKKSDLKFRMEPDHHQRAHIHIQYGKESHKATFAIDTGELLAGDLPAYQQRVATKWISDHSEPLNRLWTTLKQGENHGPIISELQGDD
ncbi:MAG: DUF4160 domain-containing protein [Chitinophagaceae bacterium]